MAASIALPRMMRIGAGALAEAPAVLAALGLERPLIVTDPFLAGQGVADRLAGLLADAGIRAQVFADTVPEPHTDAVERALNAVQSGDYDSLIGLGGGSPMDTAKAVAVLARQGGRMRDYKAPRDVTGPALPIIGIPTTAGTGSEATRFTVIQDSETEEKMLCAGLAFMPAAAIVDFELSLSMPRRLTADVGLDALTHAIEAYVSRRANPFSDGFALAAMAAIARNLRRACDAPDDRAAREAMMLAATQAGIAFCNSSVALVHGMSRPIGAHFHVAHGLSNAMLLPAITQFSAPASRARYAACSRAMGAAPTHADDGAAVGLLIEELWRLNADLNVPSPKAHGLDELKWRQLIPLMAEEAIASGSPGNNPRTLTAQEIQQLYEEVWG
jgi:alcohol dehydrogenase class IV